MEVTKNVIVGRHLRQRTRAARPLVVEVELGRRIRVIRVIECMPVQLQRLRAQHSVIQHTLHAIAILAVAGNPQEVPRQLEMRITPARRLEAMLRVREARIQRPGVRCLEALIRTPPARRITLRLEDHLVRVRRRPQMLLAPAHHVRLHRRAQRIAKAVSMMIRQHILVLREWIEVSLIQQILRRHRPVTLARSALRRQVQVLRHRVRLIPAIISGRVLTRSLAPRNLRRVAIQRRRRQMRFRRVRRSIQKIEGIRHARKLVRIDQADHHLVVVISRKAKVGIKLPRNRRRIQIQNLPQLGLRHRIAIDSIASSQR